MVDFDASEKMYFEDYKFNIRQVFNIQYSIFDSDDFMKVCNYYYYKKYNNKSCSIFKLEDDWFLLLYRQNSKSDNEEKYYKFDGFEDLKSHFRKK